MLISRFLRSPYEIKAKLNTTPTETVSKSNQPTFDIFVKSAEDLTARENAELRALIDANTLSYSDYQKNCNPKLDAKFANKGFLIVPDNEYPKVSNLWFEDNFIYRHIVLLKNSGRVVAFLKGVYINQLEEFYDPELQLVKQEHNKANSSNTFVVSMVVTDEKFRQRGLLKKMLQKIGSELKIEFVVFHIVDGNEASKQAFAKSGAKFLENKTYDLTDLQLCLKIFCIDLRNLK